MGCVDRGTHPDDCHEPAVDRLKRRGLDSGTVRGWGGEQGVSLQEPLQHAIGIEPADEIRGTTLPGRGPSGGPEIETGSVVRNDQDGTLSEDQAFGHLGPEVGGRYRTEPDGDGKEPAMHAAIVVSKSRNRGEPKSATAAPSRQAVSSASSASRSNSWGSSSA